MAIAIARNGTDRPPPNKVSTRNINTQIDNCFLKRE